MPSRLARVVLQDAGSRLKLPMEQLHIRSLEEMTECFRSPTAAPKEPCLTQVTTDRLRVVVTNFQEDWVYEVNRAGKVLSVQRLMGRLNDRLDDRLIAGRISNQLVIAIDKDLPKFPLNQGNSGLSP
ncbi:hypothetical protein ACN4EG_04380 [Alkalinema pantanalense CENA528]|uniref:hypothetical protein n=1 Tax=Alkalinema pantanalense TaxID=1620705 RepID=UPI003D7003B7